MIHEMSQRKLRNVISILLVFLISVVLISVVTFIVLISFSYFQVEEQEEEIEIFRYKYTQLNPKTNDSSLGFVSLSTKLDDGFVTFEDDEDLIMISEFGLKSYECRGSCFCDQQEIRRSSVPIFVGVSYLVAAVSSVIAYEISKNYFREKCVLESIESSSSSSCPLDRIRSDVDDDKCWEYYDKSLEDHPRNIPHGGSRPGHPDYDINEEWERVETDHEFKERRLELWEIFRENRETKSFFCAGNCIRNPDIDDIEMLGEIIYEEPSPLKTEIIQNLKKRIKEFSCRNMRLEKVVTMKVPTNDWLVTGEALELLFEVVPQDAFAADHFQSRELETFCNRLGEMGTKGDYYIRNYPFCEICISVDLNEQNPSIICVEKKV